MTTLWPILLILVSVTVFSGSDTVAKWLGQSLPAIEIAWLRYVVFTAFALALAGRRRALLARPRRPSLQLWRGVALVGSALLFIAGLAHLPIAEATAIGFASPAFITALSVVVLQERVGWRRWAALAVGLLGVLIVVRPGAGVLDWGALFPIGSAACWAAAVVITRKMGATDRAETTLLWSALTGLALLTLAVPFVFVWPGARQAGLAVLLGVTSSAGQYLVILAYRLAPASVLAPFSYAQIVSSSAMGALVFGALPDGWTLVGVAVVIASGLYTAHRERVRASG